MSDPWLDNIRTRATEAQFTDLDEILGLLTRVASLEAEVKRLRRGIERARDASCICPPGWATEQGEHGNLCPARFYPTAAETDAAVSSIASIASQASAPTGGQGAALPTSVLCRDCNAEYRPGSRARCPACGSGSWREPATSGQGAAATADDEAFEMPLPDCQDGVHVPGCRQYTAPAPAAQPATETCGTCAGYRTVRETPTTPEEEAAASKRWGARFAMKPCPDCTTPRKEGP